MVSFKTLAPLVIIVALGLGLRLYRLTEFPPSLNWDEVSHAYTAYSLLHTGRDQWGTILPVFNFRAYGDYPTTLNLYLTVPAIAVLGPTDIAARFPQALWGGITIVLVCLAGYYWRRDARVGLVAAALAAFEPWSVFTSRTVLQANVAVLWLSLAAVCYFKSRYQPRYLWGTAVALVISLFAYHNTRVFVPLLATGLGWAAWRMKTDWRLWLAVVGMGAVIILLPQARSRGIWVGILDQGAIAHLNQQRAQSTSPPLLTRLVYNRPVYLLGQAAMHYIDYFSPQFLFARGGTQYQFSLPHHGLLYWADLPFFYLGLWPAISSPFVLLWLILGPLPAAITTDKFAVVRSMTMLPVVYLVTASGLVWVVSRLPRYKSVVLAVFVGVYLLGMEGYLRQYFVSYNRDYSSSWQYGYKQAVAYVRSHYDQYDQIIFTKKYGEPHEFVLWYWPWPPAQYLSETVDWDYHDNWYWVNSFAKFRFVNDWEMKQYVASLPAGFRYLIVASPDNLPDGSQVDQINFLNNQPAFIVKEKT